MEYFKVGYGLVTENDPKTENCNLFYAQYLLLKSQLNIQDFNFFSVNMAVKWQSSPNKIYNRRSGLDSRSMSHDEITGFMVASRLLDTSHRKTIWKHFVSHLGTWNNTGKIIDWLPFNFGNYYAWGSYANSWIRWFFLPLYIINMTIAVNKNKLNTSSKIIYWLELFSMPSNWVNRKMQFYYVFKMKKQYGASWLRGLYTGYFEHENKENFPLWVELINYENRESSWFKSN